MDIFDRRAAKVMLLAEEAEPFDSSDHLFELKLDGERCLAYLDKDGTDLINRRDRRQVTQFPELTALHKQIKKRCILDGEIIAGEGRKEDFEFIKQRAVSKNPYSIQRLARENPTTFVALDILYLGREQITELPLVERQQLLRKNIADSERLTVVRSIGSQGIKLFDAVKAQDLEGVVAKRKDSVYRMGKRSRDWIKIKNWNEDDFIICGYILNENAAVASLVIGQYTEADELAYKGRVTLGLRRDEFKLVTRQPKIRLHLFNEPNPDGCSDAVWIKPKLVCRIGFMCRTDNGRLRQPFFKYMQPDIPAVEVREPARELVGV